VGTVEYQQSDWLSTQTDLPTSGSGSSTPEGAAGNADYSAWQWEVVLASVLSIPIPDRAEVTGQPWLTILHDGQPAGGSHLIWSADWDSQPTSGATSIQVYLNPALYTVGGSWDRFLNAPVQALSGVPARDYAGLPLVPPSFGSASVAVAGVTSWLQSAAQDFGSLHQDALSGPVVGFQGNMADVVAELFGSLQTVMVSLHEQLTNPTPYSDSIGTAGSSATNFLNDILSAYSSWTQVVEHSPLGAIVAVLEAIATPGSGGYVIPDPQNTPYGDLTLDASWAQVEQQAKNVWMSALAGGSADFTGLDLLGRTALSKLVDQFATTTAVIVPVIGPATPPLTPNPANNSQNGPRGGPGGTNGPGGPGGPGDPGGPGGPGGPNLPVVGTVTISTGAGDPGGGPGGFPPAVGTIVGASGPTSGPVNLSVNLGGPGGGPAGSLPGLGVMPVGLLAGGLLGPGADTGTPSGVVTPAGTEDFALLGGPAVGLSGAIGASAEPGGFISDQLGPGSGPLFGFTGTIGQPNAAGDDDRGPDGRGRDRTRRDKKGAAAMPLKMPAAGFSLGQDPSGEVLRQSVVAAMAARPPMVTSGLVNVQLMPGTGGTPAATGVPSVPGSPVGPVPAPGDAGPGVIGDGGGRGAIGVNVAIGADGAEGQDGVAMLPPGGMGGMGMGGIGMGGGLGRAERERLAYLPEESRYWGTEPALGASSLGSDADDDATEPEFESGPAHAFGIGAQIELSSSGSTISDRRMR
jgi:hypothetical protein